MVVGFLALVIPVASFAAEPVTHQDPETMISPEAARAAADEVWGPAPSSEPTAVTSSYAVASSWCGDELTQDDVANQATTEPRIKIIYAYASDQASRFGQYSGVIQSHVKTVSRTVAAASGEQKSLRFDMGTRCGPNHVDILSLRLPRPLNAYLGSNRLDVLMTDVRASAPIQAMQGTFIYSVYADKMGTNYGAAGEGQLYSDPRPGADNIHNRGGLMSVMWGTGGADFYGDSSPGVASQVLLHELTHNLGGVQNAAVRSTGAYHCYDELDHECYNDGGGSIPSGGLTSPCSAASGYSAYVREAYDCGYNDYFNPHGNIIGKSGAPIWNIFNSTYLCPLSSCQSSLQSPVARITANPTNPVVGSLVQLDASASSDGDGTITLYEWDLDGNGSYERSTGLASGISASIQASGQRTLGVRITDSDNLSATAQVSVNVPTGGPRALLRVPTGAKANTLVHLDAGSSQATADSRIVKFQWDLDGNGQFERSTGDIPWLDASFGATGNYPLRVRVTDNQGRAAEAATTLGVGVPSKAGPRVKFRRTLTRQNLRRALARGIRTRVSVSAAAAIQLKAYLPGRQAKRLRLSTRSASTVIGTTRVRFTRAGAKRVAIRFNSRAKRALKRTRKVDVSVQGSPLVQQAPAPTRLGIRLQRK